MELLADPSVFFLDEPTSGLDPGTEQKLMITLSRLSKTQGKTIVMGTHTTQSLELCDKVIFSNVFVYIGDINMGTLSGCLVEYISIGVQQCTVQDGNNVFLMEYCFSVYNFSVEKNSVGTVIHKYCPFALFYNTGMFS